MSQIRNKYAILEWLQNRANFRLPLERIAKLEQLLARMTVKQFEAWLAVREQIATDNSIVTTRSNPHG